MSFTRQEWCRDVLVYAGNSTPDDILIDFMVGWTCHETSANSGARFNLLNSEHKAPGSTNFNPNGVQSYVSYGQGIQMTVNTLNDGNYPVLLQALKSNTVAAFVTLAADILSNLSTWCGGCGYGANFVALGPSHRNDTFQYGDAIMSDYPGAIWSPNNNFFPDTGKKSFLILHGTAGGSSAQGIADYFKGTEGSSNPVGSNYIVDQAGVVIQTVAEKDGAYAQGVVNNPNWQGNPNLYCISIEHVKSSTDNSDALTPAQQAASFPLIKDICQRNGIGMHDADDTTGITGHFAIDPVNRARCPGNYPWQDLWNYLQGGNTMNIPAGWKDDNTTLTAPNGHHVIQGFRDWVLQHAWDPANVPLEDVEAANPVEDYFKSTGGTRQCFNYCELAWTQARGIYVVGIGNELLGCRKDRDALKAQIATLQAQITQLETLPVVANFQQIATIGKQIADDVNLILKLAQVQ